MPSLQAQDRPYEPNYPSSTDHGRPVNFVDRVLTDLNRVQTDYKLREHSRKDVNSARDKLRTFEDRWVQGKFDDDKLKDAINDIEHLTTAKEIRGRDRDMLTADLRDLRDFRATRGRSVTGTADRYNERDRYDRDHDR